MNSASGSAQLKLDDGRSVVCKIVADTVPHAAVAGCRARPAGYELRFSSPSAINRRNELPQPQLRSGQRMSMLSATPSPPHG